jgi:hypothetical protein
VQNDARYKREVKSRISTAKAAFSKEKFLFTSGLNLDLRKKLVKCYIWSRACVVLKIRQLQKVDLNYLKFGNLVAEKNGEDELDR